MRLIQQRISEKEIKNILNYLKEKGEEIPQEEKIFTQEIEIKKRNYKEKIVIEGKKEKISETKKFLKDKGYITRVLRQNKSKHFKWENTKIKIYKRNDGKWLIELEKNIPLEKSQILTKRLNKLIKLSLKNKNDNLDRKI